MRNAAKRNFVTPAGAVMTKLQSMRPLVYRQLPAPFVTIIDETFDTLE